MKATKLMAALTAAALFIGMTGCSGLSGGSKKAGDVEDAFDTYISKVMKGKNVAKYVENGLEKAISVTDDQAEVLSVVLKNSTYKIKNSESNKKKGEGRVSFEFKYPDVEMLAEDYFFRRS